MAVDTSSIRSSAHVSLFGELKSAHEGLIAAIESLDRLTDGPVPGEEQLTAVRWRLSKASLIRRMLWGKIHYNLSSIVDNSARDSLRHLQDVDIRLLRESTRHVGQWKADVVLNCWPAYCDASRRMRVMMMDAIAEEQRILYPILTALAEDRSAFKF